MGRQHGLSASDVDDLRAWVRSRIVETDYAVLGKFAGRSSLATYLAVVIANLFRDYRNSRWGRWRPSAAAIRLGPLATRLESLVYRDGYPLREAFEILKTDSRVEHEAELRRLFSQLPPRTPVREVSLEAATLPVPDPHSDPVSQEESRAGAERTEAVLQEALRSLPPLDQVIVRMRFWDGFSVADIARLLRLDQKPLYRRVEAIQNHLRAHLKASGIDRRHVAALVGGDDDV